MVISPGSDRIRHHHDHAPPQPREQVEHYLTLRRRPPVNTSPELSIWAPLAQVARAAQEQEAAPRVLVTELRVLAVPVGPAAPAPPPAPAVQVLDEPALDGPGAPSAAPELSSSHSSRIGTHVKESSGDP